MCMSRRMAAIIAAAAMTVVIMPSAKGFAQADRTAEQAVLQAESNRFAAMRKADVAALEELLAAELSYTHSNASVQDKTAFIGDIRTGRIKYLTVEPSDTKVQVFGTVAIVTGAASVHVIQDGNDLKIKIRYTNAHINRSGSWQMVAWQSTRQPS